MRRTVVLAWQVTAALSLMLGAGAYAAEPGGAWQAGFGRADITPERPVFMSGYASRDKPSDGVAAPIFAKALVLVDVDGRKSVLVTTDLSGVWTYFTDPIVDEVAEKIGAERDRFLFTCSHNHSGPTISLNSEARGAMSKEDAENTVAYTQSTQRKIAEAILAANADLKPAKLSWGVGVAPFVMNRREVTDTKGIILGANPRGPADRSVPVLKVESPEGTLRGVVFGAAAHNTTLGGNNYKICGDYAGYAQEFVEAEHPGVQAMFVLGCAGDANPYPRGRDTSFDYVVQHGRTLGQEVCRVLDIALVPVVGPIRVAKGVAELPFQQQLNRAELEKVAASGQNLPAENARTLLKKLDEGEMLPTHQPCIASVWQFSGDLTLVALSGEVVVDYVYLIEGVLGPRRLWIAAYSHDLPGYITSARVQQEGGYEAKGISGKGMFALDAQDVYVAKVRELATEAGRALQAAAHP
jgi:hypothetical protein